MSWDRRQFLKSLAGMAAAAGLDPEAVVAPLADAPLAEIKQALSACTISIAGRVFPLLQVIAPTLVRSVMEVTRGPWSRHPSTEREYIHGPARVSPMTVEVDSSLVSYNELCNLFLKPAGKVEVEIKLGGAAAWKFDAFLRSMQPHEGTASMELVPTGAITFGEGA